MIQRRSPSHSSAPTSEEDKGQDEHRRRRRTDHLFWLPSLLVFPWNIPVRPVSSLVMSNRKQLVPHQTLLLCQTRFLLVISQRHVDSWVELKRGPWGEGGGITGTIRMAGWGVLQNPFPGLSSQSSTGGLCCFIHSINTSRGGRGGGGAKRDIKD